MKERWPKSAEENLKRLGDAGIPMDRGVEKCNNVSLPRLQRRPLTNAILSAMSLAI
jgi:hypothetical protein